MWCRINEWPYPAENRRAQTSKDCCKIKDFSPCVSFFFSFRLSLIRSFFPSFSKHHQGSSYLSEYLAQKKPDYLKWSIIVNLPAVGTISALATCLWRLSRCLSDAHSQIFSLYLNHKSKLYNLHKCFCDFTLRSLERVCTQRAPCWTVM